MTKRDWIEVGVSLLSGAGIGAALMYLFDPDMGEERRERAAERASDYAATAGETLGAGWERVAEAAQHAAYPRIQPMLVDMEPDQAYRMSLRIARDLGWRIVDSTPPNLRGEAEAHVDATDSAVGQRILTAWENESKCFTKVMPRDYKRVLQAIAEAEQTGDNVDEAIMAAANG